MKILFSALPALATLSFAWTSPAVADPHQEAQNPVDPWADFHAGGNEPFWSLTFGESEMAFEHMGVLAVEAPRAAPQTTFGGTIFISPATDTAAHDFIVLVEDRICSDSMSGRPFPNSVRVFVEGLHFAGCGGDTETLLTGNAWQVTSLGGETMAASVTQTLMFDSDGGLSGSGGCNRYTTRYELGEGIDFGPVASTRMACPGGNVGQLENRFFAALGAAISFEISDDGVLTLFDENGPVLTASR